jgi:hypothetical protein
MTTKSKKTGTKKTAKSADATEKARKDAIATIETRLAAKPERPAKGTKSKAAKPAKPAKEKKAKRTSALDAAATVLAKAGKPMNAKEMIAAMASGGLWTSPGGKTPEATLYAAIIREIAKKGSQSRFKKSDRGMFASNGKGA